MTATLRQPGSLSVAETTELADRLAELTAAGLALPDGLRAAAEDVSSRRLAGVLRLIAAELQSGASLDVALGRLDRQLPAYVQGVVRAGIRSGELPAMLSQLAQADRRSRQLWREIRLALAYPAVLLAMMTALLLFVALFVVPQFETIYADFDTELPMLTNAVLDITRVFSALFESTIVRMLFAFAVGVFVLYVAMRIALACSWSLVDPTTLRSITRARGEVSLVTAPLRIWPGRIMTTFPMFGPMLAWSQVATWARLLAVLVEARVPLPDALSLAATAMRSANMADLSQRLATGVRGGSMLSDEIRGLWWLPMSMWPITAWGEKSGELPQALRTLAEMYEGRVRLRASLIRQVAPPVFFIFIASFAMFTLGAVFAPLVSLIQQLA